MSIDHVERQLDGESCRVFFFRAWSGYSHPVRPTLPCTYEEALASKTYYRAWLAGTTEHPRFVLFEGMAQTFDPYVGEIRASEVSAGRFHRAVKTDGGLTVAGPLSIEETFDVSEYVLTADVGSPPTPPRLVRRTVRYRYRYRYSASGALTSTAITNQAGKVTVIKN